MLLRDRNAALFLERFPQFGLDLLLAEPKKGLQEDIKVLPVPGIELIYVYGLGRGTPYKELKAWLSQDPRHSLVFLEEDAGFLLDLFDLPLAKEILSNSQVSFELLPKKKWTEPFYEILAAKRPVAAIEVKAVASKRNSRFRSLQKGLLRWTTFSSSLQHERMHSFIPFSHFLKNLPFLPNSFYANGLKGKFTNVPAIICGAGPSLDQSTEFLRKAGLKALLFAAGSAIGALHAKGIEPHFGMAVDPNPEEYERLKNLSFKQMALLYSTRLFPQVLAEYKGPLGYFRSGIGDASEAWVEEALGLFEPLVSFGLSAEVLAVTPVCIAFAMYLGCNPIIFTGVDLANAEGRIYAEGVSFSPPKPSVLNSDQLIWKKNSSGGKVQTAVKWLMEARAIRDLIRGNPHVKCFNASPTGLPIVGAPYASLEKILANAPELDLRGQVAVEIAKTPMPEQTFKILAQKREELAAALNRIFEYVSILAEKKQGSLHLAKIELEEEDLFHLFFFGIKKAFSKGDELVDWKGIYNLVEKYQQLMSSYTNRPLA